MDTTSKPQNMVGRGEVRFTMEDLPTDPNWPFKQTSRILARTFVDGRQIGAPQVVASGPRWDIEEYFNGEITFEQLEARLMQLGPKARS